LRNRHVEVIRAGTTESVASCHRRGIRTEVRDPKECRIRDRNCCRQCADLIVVGSAAGHALRNRLEGMLSDWRRGGVARNAVARIVVGGVVKSERRPCASSEDTGQLVTPEQFAEKGSLLGKVRR